MINKEAVATWVKRWNAKQDSQVRERLKDLPRPGTPDRFAPKQVCRLIALAYESPERYGPITHWTSRELAAEAVKQNIVESISVIHVGRLLKKTNYNRTATDTG